MPLLSFAPEWEHASSKVLKCSTRSRGARPLRGCTPISAEAFRSKSFRCCVLPAFCAIDAARRTVEGMPEHTAGQPSHSDYLPLFRRGLAPVSMTTGRQLCLAGLDIQSGAGKGCTGATQQMHFPQWDPLILCGAACKLASQHGCWWESPRIFLALPTFCILSLQLRSLRQPDSPVTASYYLEPSFKYMLLFVCDWMSLSLSRSWTWINHQDTRLLCPDNKAVTSPYHTHSFSSTHR